MLAYVTSLKQFHFFQIGADGRRSQIYLALSTAAEFRDHLSSFSDYYASLGIFNSFNYLFNNNIH